jgi:transcriptional regulator of nitric oxide reductase
VKDPSKRAGYQDIMDSAFVKESGEEHTKVEKKETTSWGVGEGVVEEIELTVSNITKNVYEKEVSEEILREKEHLFEDYQYVKYFVNFQKVPTTITMCIIITVYDETHTHIYIYIWCSVIQ